MATKENINWKRINMGDILPCQSFLRKKNGEILKLSTVGGVKVGQDCYYLPVDEVINVIKDYPVEESEDERIRKAIYNCVKWFGFDSIFFKDVSQEECLAWLEKQGEQKPAEWDKNDEVLLDETLHFIREFQQSDRCINEGDMQNSVTCENWLKSLRPQSTWKPSGEQMEYLAKAIATLGDEGDCKTALILNGLRFELKKLREE